ncbi:MAG: hypothetical protein EOL87_02310 [Spartobacteria bacterium]|nr:hypothetical protein [Spartobacteria bacterium]
MTITEIKDAVQALPEKEFEDFCSWFDEYEEQHWDQQIEQDQKSSPLLNLIHQAQSEFKEGKCTQL